MTLKCATVCVVNHNHTGRGSTLSLQCVDDYTQCWTKQCCTYSCEHSPTVSNNSL